MIAALKSCQNINWANLPRRKRGSFLLFWKMHLVHIGQTKAAAHTYQSPKGSTHLRWERVGLAQVFMMTTSRGCAIQPFAYKPNTVHRGMPITTTYSLIPRRPRPSRSWLFCQSSLASLGPSPNPRYALNIQSARLTGARRGGRFGDRVWGLDH